MAKKTANNKELTREEVRLLCEGWSQAESAGMGHTLRGDFSNDLAGETLEISLHHGYRLTYRIDSGTRLRWSDQLTDNQPETAQILELHPGSGLFLINHLRSGTFPLENVTLIVDVRQGQVTVFVACLGASSRSRDVSRTISFGNLVDRAAPEAYPHHFSTDLVGQIIDWHYDRSNQFVVKHLYVNNEHMVYHIIRSDLDEIGLVEAAECDYIKVRENVYIMSWLEKGHQGMQGVVLIDLESMHDIGNFFGISINNCLENYTFAADGEFSDLGKVII